MDNGKTAINYTRTDLRRLVIPLVIEQVLSICVGLADQIMVAQLGEAAISAVSIVDTLNTLLIAAFSALATGGAVIAGQYMGRSEMKKAGHAGAQLILFMTEISMLVMILIYVGKGFIFSVVYGEIAWDVEAHASLYFLIVEASIPMMAIYNAGAALLRIMGNSKLPMRISLIMNVINVAGNALMIFGLGCGVEGVAIPTLVSRLAAAVIAMVMLWRPGLSLRIERVRFKHDWQVARQIVHFGVPSGMENGMFQLGKVVLVSTVSALGTAEMAAHSIGHTFSSVQFMVGIAFGHALVTVVSHCVGAGEFEKARHYTRMLVKGSYLGMVASGAACLLFLPVAMWLYNLSPEAEVFARQIVWWHTFMAIALWPMAFTLPNALRAAGDTRFVMIVSTITMWTMRVGVGVVLIHHIGVIGLWMAMGIDWIWRIIFFVPRFRGHKWETMGVKK